MKSILFLALFLLLGVAYADTFYLNSTACLIDNVSGNEYCILPSNASTILNSTSDIYTAIDGAEARFGGYATIEQNTTCGATYTNLERAISITSTPLKYNRIDTINPAGSIIYSETNLTVQANSCPVCNTTTVVYNTTVNETNYGLFNYSGSIVCGDKYENEDYNITINTTPSGSGTVLLYPNESRLFPTCGYTAFCQPIITTCPVCDINTLKTQFGCTGTRQLKLGESTDACGITVIAPSAPATEYRNISAGESIVSLERGYSIECSEYDCYTDAMAKLNLTATNCTTNISKPDGTLICLDDWRQNCNTDQILAGQAGLNDCFASNVMSFRMQYEDCSAELQNTTYELGVCNTATEKSSIWAYIAFAIICIIVGGYSLAKILKHFRENKRKVPQEHSEKVK